jgi:protein phosphatase 1 regulatory subunit 11
MEEERVVHIVVRPRRRVVWDESVLDNEFHGRRSSKGEPVHTQEKERKHTHTHTTDPRLFSVCCIFHPRRTFGESSDESSSSSSSGESDTESGSSSGGGLDGGGSGGGGDA